MALPYETLLAHRELTRHPWHSLTMVIGLALAVTVMIYIPSTMASFYDDMIDRTIEQNSAHITVWPPERQPGRMTQALRGGQEGSILAFADYTFPRHHDLNGYHELAGRVSATPGVIAVAPFVRGDATVNIGRVNMGIAIEGIIAEDYRRVVNIAKHFPDGHVPRMGSSDIAIGFRMADKLGVAVGEHIHVATPSTQRLMKVKAIFRSGYYEKDMHSAYVALSTAQRMFGMGSEISGIAARCTELNQAGPVTELLSQKVTQKVRNWKDDNASLLTEVATVKRVTWFINILVALVASAGMANVFSVFVLNRQKELAILRAMGASRVSLKAILLMEAAFIWFVGTVIGSTAALVVMAFEQSHPYEVSAETYGISSYATQPMLWSFLLAAALSAATMALSAWWSGRKAARLNPAAVIFGR